jgi:hypothetical protein
VRLLPRRFREHARRYAPAKLALLGIVVIGAPMLAFAVAWQVGLAILAAYVALGFGVWTVARLR